MRRFRLRAAAARVAVAGAIVGAPALGAVTSAGATSPHPNTVSTYDDCTKGGYHNYTTWGSVYRADTYVQWQFGSFYDPDCTGYVQVKIQRDGALNIATSSTNVVALETARTGWGYSDHNARADSGVLSGFRLK